MFSKTLPRKSAFEELLYDILNYNVAQTYKELFIKEQFLFILLELERFQNCRARTFTRTFDRGVVRRQNNDLKKCRLLAILSWVFYYAGGKEGEGACNFYIVEGRSKLMNFERELMLLKINVNSKMVYSSLTMVQRSGDAVGVICVFLYYWSWHKARFRQT